MKPIDAMFKYGAIMLQKEFQQVVEEFEHMDLFGFTPNGECCEIEIKTADYDLHKEFKKKSKIEKHEKYMRAFILKEGFVPTRFYFLLNKNISQLALRLIRVNSLPYGVLEYDPLKDTVTLVKKSEKLSTNPFQGEFNILKTKAPDFKHKRAALQ